MAPSASAAITMTANATISRASMLQVWAGALSGRSRRRGEDRRGDVAHADRAIKGRARLDDQPASALLMQVHDVVLDRGLAVAGEVGHDRGDHARVGSVDLDRRNAGHV